MWTPRSGTTLPAASRNQPTKMNHAALAWLSPGIGSSIGSADKNSGYCQASRDDEQSDVGGTQNHGGTSQAIWMQGATQA